MEIIELVQSQDLDRVMDLFQRAADYVELEEGAPPSRETAIGFFEDRPPGLSVRDTTQFGILFREVLVGVMAMSQGYPSATDAYIGLLLLEPKARGQGIGSRAVAAAKEYARGNGAARLLVAVLDANPKGRAFWEREGFRVEQSFPAGVDGHIRHRLELML